MKRIMALTQQVRRGSSEDDGAGCSGLAAREADEAVLAHHDLINQAALAQSNQFRLVEGGCDLSAVVT